MAVEMAAAGFTMWGQPDATNRTEPRLHARWTRLVSRYILRMRAALPPKIIFLDVVGRSVDSTCRITVRARVVG